jgi:PAS domain S-box-containing protein
MYTVLYVDDEPGLLELGKAFLEMSGVMTVETAISADQALKLLKIAHFDCIISDYQMPVMDGIKFLKHLRQEKNTIPFILFTGRGREEVVIEAVNNGVDYYLQKGGDPRAQFVELEHKTVLAIEHRRTGNELKESRQRMTEIIDHLPDATLAISPEGTVIAWNKAIEEMTGVPKEQILGTGNYSYSLPFHGTRRPTLIDLILHEEAEIGDLYPTIVRKDHTLISEIRVPTLYEGKGAYLWMTASPLSDTNGRITGAIESIRDITDRKRAEEAVRASEERYRAVIEDQTEFITRFLPDGTHVFVNEAYCRYFGKTPTQIIGTKFTPDLFEEDKPRVRRHFRNLTRENPVGTMEHRIVMPDGTIRWQQWSDRAIFDENGILKEYQSVGRDITDRKEAEDELRAAYEQIMVAEEELRKQYDELKKSGDALRESEEKYRSLVDNLNVGVYRNTAGSPGRWLWANPAFLKMFGYESLQEFQGKPVTDLYVNPDDRRAFLDQVRIRGYARDFILQLKRKDGIPVWVSITGQAKKNARGTIDWIDGICEDITDKKKAEEALRASVEMYQAIFNNTGSATIIIEEDTTISFVNPEFERVMGYSKEEVEGKKFWTELVVPEDAEQMNHYHVLRRTDPENAPRNYEFRFITKGGQVRSAYLTIGLIPGTKKTVASFVDITEKKHADAALRESERNYRTILENIQDAYYRSDTEGNLIMISPSVLKLAGFENENELLGKNIAETVYADPSERKIFLEALEQRGFVNNFEVTLKRRDGTTVIVETSSHKYYDENGNFLGVEGIFRDITKRKQAELALERSEVMYRTIFENTGTATVLIEDSTIISLANAEFERLSGYSREEIVGKKSWTEFVAKEDLERMLTQHVLRREQQESVLNTYEFRFVTKSGAVRKIHLTIDIIPGTRRSVASLIDITDNVATREALKQTNKKLNLINSITRHDITNQLSTLTGFLELSKRKVTDPELLRFIEKEENAADYIHEQIEFAKNYEKLGTLEPLWQRLKHVIPRSLVPPTINLKEETGDVEILADPMLPKVFNNLIDNSVRHGQNVTEIRISCSPEKGTLVIVYQDNGTGIPAINKEQIFDREFGENTGLGLFLVREILAITGITIRETGTPGSGARFEILVPKDANRVYHENR